MKFTVFNKKNGNCPICSSNSGKCKQAEALILCMENAGTANQTIINGYKKISDSKDNQWGLFVAVDENASKEWVNQNKKKSADPKITKLLKAPQIDKTVEKEAKPMTVSLETRDRDYRYMLRGLGLKETHRRDLLQRGLTDADMVLYRSVLKNQAVPSAITSGVPGVANGKLAVFVNDSYLVPVTNYKQQILGFQRRICSPQGDAAKYTWVSGDRYGDSVNVNGETPMGVYGFCHDGAIIFTEGYLKAHITSVKYNRLTLGAANANFTHNGFITNQLKETLDHYQAMFPNKRLELFFGADSGSVNNYHVMLQYAKLHVALERHGYHLDFLWWDQREKAKGWDIDEIMLWNNPPEIYSISWNEFLAYAPESIQLKLHHALTSDRNSADRKLSEISTVYREVNKQYITAQDIAAIATDGGYFRNQIIGIKSVQGTGKTEALRVIAKQLHDNQDKVQFITHRTSLGQSLAQSLGVIYVGERSASSLPEADRHMAYHEGYGICINSLYKASVDDFDGAVLVLDEYVQILYSMLTSQTIISKDSVYSIFHTFRQIIVKVLTSGGTIICLDADLNAESIKFLLDVCEINGFKPEVLTLNNLYVNGGRGEVAVVENRQTIELNIAEQCKQQKNVYVCGDSKEEITMLYHQCPYLAWDEKPELGNTVKRKILLCSDTTSNDAHPASEFCGDGVTTTFDSNCLNYNGVFATTSIATGSSQFTKHFDYLAGIYSGMIGAKEICQQMMRIRYALDTDIYIKPDITQAQAELPWNGLVAGGKIESQDVLNYYWEKFDSLQTLAQMHKITDGEESRWGVVSPEFEAMAVLVAESNRSILSLKLDALTLLKSKGFKLVESKVRYSPQELTSAKEASAEVKASLRAKSRQKELTAKQISEIEYNKLSKKAKISPEQQWEVKRYQTEQLFGQEVSATLLELRDEEGIYNVWKHRWLAKTDTVTLAKYEVERAKQNVYNSASRNLPVYLPSAIKNDSVIASVYDYLGFADVINTPYVTYTESHPLVQRLVAYLNSVEDGVFQKLLGVCPTSTNKKQEKTRRSGLSLFASILQTRFGLKLKISKKTEIIDGQKVRTKSVVVLPLDYEDLMNHAFVAWDKKVVEGIKYSDETSAKLKAIFSHSLEVSDNSLVRKVLTA